MLSVVGGLPIAKLDYLHIFRASVDDRVTVDIIGHLEFLLPVPGDILRSDIRLTASFVVVAPDVDQ